MRICSLRFIATVPRWMRACCVLFLFGAWGAIALAEQPADIRVLIDISGSMQQSDPRNLRRPALDLLVETLPADAKAGVWTFGKYVNMLVPHGDVTPAWRRTARQQSAKINSVAQRTNIGAVLKEANYDADPRRFPKAGQYRRAVILLTDGKVDIDRNAAINQRERQRVLSDILPAYQKAGVTIHSVALSGNADTDLMQTLAEQTGGLFARANDASELHKIFIRLLDQAAASDSLPLTGNRFVVDKAISEFSALVFKKTGADPVVLHSPSGTLLTGAAPRSGVRWLSHDNYDLVTVQSPAAGEWRIEADIDPDSRVTIVSDLRLEVDALPTLGFISDQRTLGLRIKDDQGPIKDAAFLALIDVSATLYRNDKAVWQGNVPRANTPTNTVGGDGAAHYRKSLDMLAQAGNYRLRVDVDGKTFQRAREIFFELRNPFRSELDYNAATREFKLTVVAEHERFSADSNRVSASLIDAGGELKLLEIAPVAGGVWSYQGLVTGGGEVALSSFVTGPGLPADGLLVSSETMVFDAPLASKAVAPPVAVEPPVNPNKDANAAQLPAPEAEADIVVAEPEPEPVPVEKTKPVEAAPAEQEGTPKWVIYAALALGNLLMLGGLALLYRKITAPARTDESEAEAETVSETESAEPEPAVAAAEQNAEQAPQELAQEEAQEEALQQDAPAVSDGTEEVQAERDAEVETEVETEVEIELETEVESEPATKAPMDKGTTGTAAEALDVDEPVDIQLDVSEVDADTAADEAGQDLVDSLDGLLGEDDPDEDTLTDGAADQLEVSLESAIEPENESDAAIGQDSGESTGEVAVDFDDALDAAIAEANARKEAKEAAEPDAPTDAADAADDVIIDLDGEFDLSSDISDDQPPKTGAA